MNSITASKNELLLEASGVSLDYPLAIYPHSGLRDSFVRLLQHPLNVFAPQDRLPVLRNVSLQLRRGDRLGLLGLNGAGKTTLCRVLCGMILPPQGTVATRGRVEAVFDVGTGVLQELTGRENAYLLARLFMSTKEVPRDLVEEALDFSELGHFLDTPFKNYSRGMQARLVLSLVSSTPCDVLILDEVFDGADVFFREKIAARMRKKIESSGAVVFVSHGPEQVLELCNRVVVLQQGSITYDGPCEAGIEHYLRGGGRFNAG